MFADKSDDILKMIERRAYGYSSSDFYSDSRDIIEEFFKSEPQKLYRANWYFYVSFAGPDRRYLGGSSSVSSEDFAEFIGDLETALEKMKSLKKIEFKGSFNKSIRNSEPKLEVFSENNKIELKFWVQSKNYNYCQTIDISNLEEIISELKKVEEKGENLASTLESLCF